jgi:hypothetical protein
LLIPRNNAGQRVLQVLNFTGSEAERSLDHQGSQLNRIVVDWYIEKIDRYIEKIDRYFKKEKREAREIGRNTRMLIGVFRVFRSFRVLRVLALILFKP